jgi:hypothetical protein
MKKGKRRLKIGRREVLVDDLPKKKNERRITVRGHEVLVEHAHLPKSDVWTEGQEQPVVKPKRAGKVKKIRGRRPKAPLQEKLAKRRRAERSEVPKSLPSYDPPPASCSTSARLTWEPKPEQKRTGRSLSQRSQVGRTSYAPYEKWREDI